MSREVKATNEKISVTVREEEYGDSLWSFCSEDYQSTGVFVSKEQFKMICDLVANNMVIAMYEDSK